MKPIKLTRITHRYAGATETGKCYILNPNYILELFETTTHNSKEKKTIPVTEILFTDGHTIIVKEDVETIYKAWVNAH